MRCNTVLSQTFAVHNNIRLMMRDAVRYSFGLYAIGIDTSRSPYFADSITHVPEEFL